jgi:ABC-type methionine transport system ATPase subunit
MQNKSIRQKNKKEKQRQKKRIGLTGMINNCTRSTTIFHNFHQSLTIPDYPRRSYRKRMFYN